MTAGRGWIMVSSLPPEFAQAAAAAYFGALTLAFRAQIIGVDVPSTILGMILHVGTIAVLVVVTTLGCGGDSAPEAECCTSAAAADHTP
jgi:ABC-type uncharacterized transport system permease subunit